MNGLEYLGILIILCTLWFWVGYEMGKRKGFADATKIHFEALDKVFEMLEELAMEEDKDGKTEEA